MDTDYVNKIREIQKAENVQACFRTGKKNCDYVKRCCWSELCNPVKVHPITVTK
jgi:hypothetical protein